MAGQTQTEQDICEFFLLEPAVSIYVDFKFDFVGSTSSRVTFYGQYLPVDEGATPVKFKSSFLFLRLDRLLQVITQVSSEDTYHEVDKTYAKTTSWSELFCHRCMFYF